MTDRVQPRWLALAWAELGQRETAGRAANPRIRAFYREAGHAGIVSDEVAWCAAFAGAMLERAGIRCTRSLMARSYARWGEPLPAPRLGAIAVLTRGRDVALGHVGFVAGWTGSRIILLGGNQADSVSVQAFPMSRVVALRWPAIGAAPAAAEPRDVFPEALAHVLEMEGGWSDDPHDPGGPTNMGITLAELASWRGLSVDAGSIAALKSDLSRIAPETVREIYLQRYWRPAGCERMPGPLALFHFDCSVNQGTGTAIRLLQEALGAAADGEIGPVTEAAIATADIEGAVAAYAELRRRRYRALPHFWRFGRGWLARVDRTVTAAHRLAGTSSFKPSAPPTSPGLSKGESTMTKDKIATQPTGEPKWWGRSMTVWGTLITALATVLPALGPFLGFDITPDMVHEASASAVAAAQAVLGLLGTLMALFGRMRAVQPLVRKPVSLRI